MFDTKLPEKKVTNVVVAPALPAKKDVLPIKLKSSQPEKPKVPVVAPPVSVLSRVFAYQSKIQEDELPKIPCPEKLSLKDRTKLFEAAIKKEGNDAAQVRMRDQQLRSRKAGGGPESKRAKFVERESDSKAIVESASAIETPNLLLASTNTEKIQNDENIELATHTACNKLPNETSASHEEQRKEDIEVEDIPLTASSKINDLSFSSCSTGKSDGHYYAVPCQAAESTCSEGSSRLYPDLASVDTSDEHDIFTHSSPSKQPRYEEPPNISPVFAAPRNTGVSTTPFKTLSNYRLEQREKAQHAQESQPKVVYGVPNLKEVAALEERKRKELLQRRCVELKSEVAVHETMISQASKAIRESLKSAFGTVQHADAERLLLLSRKFTGSEEKNSRFIYFVYFSVRKRVATLQEIHRLNSLLKDPQSYDPARGIVKMTQISVQINKEVVLSYAKDQGKVILIVDE